MSRILKNYDNQVTQAYKGANHMGIDIVGKTNKVDDIIAHTAGTVVYCDTTYSKNNTKATGVASWGIRVIVQHAGGYYTAYNHLANVAVKKGQSVSKGQLIGRMGNSGCAYGIHLHFEVMKGGQAASYRIDPTPYINADLPSNSTAAPKPSTSTSTTKKSVEEIAKEVIAGKWGNGDARKSALEKAGYNYSEVQTKVNQLLGNSSAPSVNYYPRYTGSSVSIADALKAVGVDGSYNNRAQIAARNGISGYAGTAAQNTNMLNLLKQGKLVK